METTIGQRLAIILEETGMPKNKLAKNLGVAVSTITSYVQDVSVPPLEKLRKIANEFPGYNWELG